MDVRECSACKVTRALDEFSKSPRGKAGRRSTCKLCERAATAARRADKAIGRRPGALVLAPRFPAPPELTSSPETPTSDAHAGEAGTHSYVEAAETFIAALDPPAGDADALLVRSLRGLAELADRFSFGADIVKDTRGLVTDMLRVQRELAATRLAKAKPAAETATPPTRRAANY